jgi:hypothetical protein
MTTTTNVVHVVTVLCHTHCEAHNYYFRYRSIAAKCRDDIRANIKQTRDTGVAGVDDFHEIEVVMREQIVSRDCAVTLYGTSEIIPYIP